MYALKEGCQMENEARIARLLAVFNDLPDTDKEAVLALMERIVRKESDFAGTKQVDTLNNKKHVFKEIVV
jgi:hypothetical protein